MNPDETGRLAALEQRLAEIETRLAHLEGKRTRAPSPAARTSRMPQFEIRFGLNWLSRIAVVTVVLALAFFFQYAFENRWITEWGRVLLGIACGLAALAAGERAWRKQQRTYGQALTAAGIAFLYLSFWAAYALYHLLSQPGAFALMLAVTVAAGLLALRYETPVVALLGLGGGFATPLLLGDQGDHWFVLGYGLLLDGCAVFASRARGWGALEGLALAGTAVLFAAQWPNEPAFALFVLAYYALFAASTSKAVFITAQVLAALALAAPLDPEPGRLLLTWAIAIAGLVIADRRAWPGAVSASFAGFWLAYALWNGEARNPPVDLTIAILAGAFLTFLGWAVWRAYGRVRPLGFHDLVVLALNPACLFGACYQLHESGMFAVAIAAVQMAAARLLWPRDARGALLSSGAAWVLLVLAVPIELAGYRITIAWAAEAAALSWIGVRQRERRAVWGALAVFFLVATHLAFVDSGMYRDPHAYTLLLNARMLVFAVAAAGFWAAAWWTRPGKIAALTYTAGHIVMLWGLCLEAVGWAARTSTATNFSSSASTAVSVVAAAYAVLLVSGGAARQSAGTRIMGIVLIATVVVKLYLYDVWLLGAFYRMAAFAILGVLLLVVSYVYRSRATR